MGKQELFTREIPRKARHWAWKWFGSMFLEVKEVPGGEHHLALGLTRVMTLIMFVALMVMWLVAGIGGDVQGEPIPQSMLYTFWGLAGLKGVNKVAEAVQHRKSHG